MTREEYVNHLLGEGCIITKKRPNGMWVMLNEATQKMVAVPATDPPRASNMYLACRELGVCHPNIPAVFKAGEDIETYKARFDKARES